MLVEMELSRILIREVTDAQIIELREVDGDRAFPIVIGMPEAFAIERSLKGIEPPRPQTHDLLLSMVESLGCSLTQVVIDNLHEGTFFAKLYLVKDGNEIVVDSRPSDAIALGVARKIPIFVAESVLHEIERNPIDHDGQDFDTDQFDWD